MNQKHMEILIKKLEIRKKQLTGETKPSYQLSSGHHLRDVFTILRVLKHDTDDGTIERLLNNMPEG